LRSPGKMMAAAKRNVMEAKGSDVIHQDEPLNLPAQLLKEAERIKDSFCVDGEPTYPDTVNIKVTQIELEVSDNHTWWRIRYDWEVNYYKD
jgi:hypothetical protein